MNWEWLFGFASALALLGWIALILLPRKVLLMTAIFYLVIGLLCLVYSVLIASLLSGVMNSQGATGPVEFTSIEGVRAIFSTDGGVVLGWIHYLAFDLFVGHWIARDADAKGFSRVLQAPVLLLTFLAGPAGLLLWMILREPAARRGARARSRG